MAAWIDSRNYAGWIDWTLDITYKRSNRNDYITFSTTLYSDQIWYIYYEFDTLFYGGEALLTARPQNGDCQVTFSFSIRGENADEQTIENFIYAQPGEWYNKYVAKHESGVQNDRHYLQFNEIGALNCDLADVKHTPNWGEDCDTCPGGFGLFQLTWFDNPARPPNVYELWNWKANCNSGVNWLDAKQHQADTYMAGQRNTANYYTGDYVHNPVPNYVSANIVFRDTGTVVTEQAVALKLYNGNGGTGNGYFCEFLGSPENRWSFNAYAVWNGQKIYYVDSVCQWFE